MQPLPATTSRGHGGKRRPLDGPDRGAGAPRPGVRTRRTWSRDRARWGWMGESATSIGRQRRRRPRSRQELTIRRCSQASNRSGSRRPADRARRESGHPEQHPGPGEVAEDQPGSCVRRPKRAVDEHGKRVMMASSGPLDEPWLIATVASPGHGRSGRARRGMASAPGETFTPISGICAVVIRRVAGSVERDRRVDRSVGQLACQVKPSCRPRRDADARWSPHEGHGLIIPAHGQTRGRPRAKHERSPDAFGVAAPSHAAAGLAGVSVRGRPRSVSSSWPSERPSRCRRNRSSPRRPAPGPRRRSAISCPDCRRRARSRAPRQPRFRRTLAESRCAPARGPDAPLGQWHRP